MIISFEEVKKIKDERKVIIDRLEVAKNMSGEELEELYREYYSNN